MATVFKPESNVDPGKGGGVIKDEDREKMKRSVVFIDAHDKENIGEGSGSMVEVNEYMPKPLLLTCNHVIPSKEAAKKCSIWFDRIGDNNRGTEVMGSELFDLDKMFITHENLDFTLIAIKPDKVPGGPRHTFSFTKHMAVQDKLKEATNVTLVHYPYDKARRLYLDRGENTHLILLLKGNKLYHKAETYGGSSGCPILRENSGDWVIVAVHTGEVQNPKTKVCANSGTLIKAINEVVLGMNPHSEKPDYDTAIKEATATSQKLDDIRNPTDQVPSDVDYLTKRPTDAGLQGFLNNPNIGNLYEDIALSLGVPRAQVRNYARHSHAPGVDALRYWTNGNIKGVPTTWEFLLGKVGANPDFGPEAVKSVKEDLATHPDWSRQ